MKIHLTKSRIICLLCLVLVPEVPVLATTSERISTPELTVRLVVRTPEQIAAFYEARGFGKAMIDTLRQQCFVGIRIKNTSPYIILHDLQNWHFSNKHGPVQRRDRDYWKSIWRKMNIPMAHQSTFRWTMLPEKLDFRPDEGEGGNILLPRSKLPVTIHASFTIKLPEREKKIPIRFDRVECLK